MSHFPLVGFVVGTPILSSTGFKSIEDLNPGDMIQVPPDDEFGDDKHETHDDKQPGW